MGQIKPTRSEGNAAKSPSSRLHFQDSKRKASYRIDGDPAVLVQCQILPVAEAGDVCPWWDLGGHGLAPCHRLAARFLLEDAPALLPAASSLPQHLRLVGGLQVEAGDGVVDAAVVSDAVGVLLGDAAAEQLAVSPLLGC